MKYKQEFNAIFFNYETLLIVKIRKRMIKQFVYLLHNDYMLFKGKLIDTPSMRFSQYGTITKALNLDMT